MISGQFVFCINKNIKAIVVYNTLVFFGIITNR